MRRGLSLSIVATLLVFAADASAQRERVKVTNVKLGFTGGVYKAGQWAPVYVDLECVRDTEEKLLLIVETKDADDSITEGSVEIAPMLKGDRLTSSELGRIPYLKPGMSYGAGVTVTIKGLESGKTFGSSNEKSFSGADTASYVLLGIGTNLSGLRLPTSTFNQNESSSSRNEWVKTSSILDVGQLPDQWIGYAGVDLVILGTGGDVTFWETLSNQAHEKRRRALVEWVRRGGRLVVSVGTNPDQLDQIKEFKEMLPATVPPPPGGKRNVTALPLIWQGNPPSARQSVLLFGGKQNEFAVVALQPRPDRATKILVAEDEAVSRPVVVQAPYGLGRVTVVGFDLDRVPFTDWGGRAAFWENLVQLAGYIMPSPDNKLEKNSYSKRYDEFSGNLQGSLDYFEGVPVVSFGWVALFILIYIILIGPVDYLFLKKVIRKLEWTWVTFPLIVITVSAGAYFAAYALKGKDLKTNKVDVVDIDLAGKRIDGNTWFTLFSPRIQNYTIGVEPSGPIDGDTSVPSWTPASPTEAANDTVISWQGNVERKGYSGGSGVLISKKYKYQSGTHPTDLNRDLYAAGLEGVPIQVWTTKAFHAQWTAPIDPAKPPIVADLSVSPASENALVGTIENNLPIDTFSDRALVWRGKVYVMTDFPRGVKKVVNMSAEPGASGTENVKDWVNKVSSYVAKKQTGSTYGYPNEAGSTSNPVFRLWPILFNDYANDTIREQASNASFRRLDQSWRIASDRPEQAMLLLRIPTREGPAEDISRSPESPSRLWLGQLPTGGGKRPSVQGTLKQETYIRVFIPVKMKK
jgi:hypothetical protein